MKARHSSASQMARLRAKCGLGAGAVAAACVFAFVPGIQPGALGSTNPLAGTQGTDTSLPATSSAVTVSGRGPYADLKITVNQTQDLGNQAISVSWSGGQPTFSDPDTHSFVSTFNGDYLQIFECWGDPSSDDPLNSVNPGPSPTQCEFGGESSTPTTSYPVHEIGFEYSRVLTAPGWSNYGDVTGYSDTGPNGSGYLIEPFDAVDGTVVDKQANYNWDENPLDPTQFWQNPYFSFDDTNEVDFARTGGDGQGQQLFEVDTGVEAPGLGCGEAVQAMPDGSKEVPDCWLVIVPRGTPQEENPSGLTGVTSVVTSPLNPVAWANRIAIPLSFKPVGTQCSATGQEERIVGSELASGAASSWQSALCSVAGAPPYDYADLPDDQARGDLTQASYGSAGMAVFSDPIPQSQSGSTSPIVYAPLTLSGVVVAFNIDRSAALEQGGQYQPDELALSGVRVQHIYLTPRLVAKLLTESYQAELVDVTTDKSAAYSWVQHNPTSIVDDPDFLQFNPEFTLLTTKEQLDAATLVVEEGSSDAAATLWQWVLADPEAKAWLEGQPDPWGMKVNPYYSLDPAENPNGVAFGSSSSLNDFPKSDGYQYDTGATVYPPGGSPQPARALDILDWSPYVQSMSAAAQSAASSNDGGKTTLDPGGTSDTAWGANGPQPNGSSFVLSITDSASAAQYGLQVASLSRAGDDSPTRTFVAPDEPGLLAGEQAMQASSVPGVLVPNPSTTEPDAYPLTMLTYAAVSPNSLAATDRQSYAKFIQYATGPGQTPGDGIGQLPDGYVPLPANLKTEATNAVTTILNPPTPDATSAGTTVNPQAFPVPSQQSATTVAGSQLPEPQTLTVEPATSRVAPRTSTSARPGVSRTNRYVVGLIRWALPIGLLLGSTAALCAPGVGPTRRRKPKRPMGPRPLVFKPWSQ